MSKPFEISLNLPYDDVVNALSDLGPDEFVALVKQVEEKIGDWSVIHSMKPWVDEQHRVLVTEETEDTAKRTGKCVRSAQYEDIWGHADPHVNCVLR